MNILLYSVFGFVVNLSYVFCSDIYPSINWDPQNTLFVADGVTCGHGPRRLKVQLQSKVFFLCPNIATVLQTTSVQVQISHMYENLWIVYNKTVFDHCNTSLERETRTSRLLLRCDTPTKLNYFSLLFAPQAADQNALLFEAGKTYYFIGTSDGTESHINDKSGGHCADTTNNIYMKIEVYVCKKSNSTYQDPECLTGVGKLKCPSIPNKASSSIVTHTSSLPSNPPSTRAAETKAVCAQSVITHTTTVSTEVTPTNLVSCVDVFNMTLFNSAQAIVTGSSSPSYTVSSSGTAHLTQAVSSTKTVLSTPTTTMKGSQMIASEKSPIFSSSALATGSSTPSLTVSSSWSASLTQIVSSTHAASSTHNTTIQASQTVAVVKGPKELLIPSTNKIFTTEISPDTHSISFMERISLSTCVVITTKTVFSAVKFTESCKGCSSQSITFQLLNGERAVNQAQLSEKEKISCNKGTWMVFGIAFFILCSILLIIFLIKCIIHRKKIFHKYSSKVSPGDARNGEEMNPT